MAFHGCAQRHAAPGAIWGVGLPVPTIFKPSSLSRWSISHTLSARVRAREEYAISECLAMERWPGSFFMGESPRKGKRPGWFMRTVRVRVRVQVLVCRG